MSLVTQIWLIDSKASKLTTAGYTLEEFRQWLDANPVALVQKVSIVPHEAGWLGYLLGFRDWSYHSPAATFLATTSYNDPALTQLAAAHGFHFPDHVPISLSNHDSLRKLINAKDSKIAVQSVFHSLGVKVTDGQVATYSGLGTKKLLQLILLARLALDELTKLPNTDQLWKDSFLKYVDRDITLALLQVTASWPTDGHWVMLSETY